jgi:hypothetical protein
MGNTLTNLSISRLQTCFEELRGEHEGLKNEALRVLTSGDGMDNLPQLAKRLQLVQKALDGLDGLRTLFFEEVQENNAPAVESKSANNAPVSKKVQQRSTHLTQPHMSTQDLCNNMLSVLDEYGPLRTKEIFGEMESRLAQKFTSADIEKTRTKIPRWKATASMARIGMKQRGLVTLKNGEWHITEVGKKYLHTPTS